MNQVDIDFKGITRIPSDYACADGELAECVNFVSENGELAPVPPPREVLRCEGELLYVHKGSGYENYITVQNGTLRAFKAGADGPEYYAFEHNLEGEGDAFLGAVKSVSAIGNTLVVLCEKGIGYVLFTDGNYKFLGTKPEKPEIEFLIKTYNELYPSNDDNCTKIAQPVNCGTSGDKTFTDEESTKVTSAIMAEVNKLLQWAKDKKLLVFPCFVRYAFRLYDGSTAWASAPILLRYAGYSPSRGWPNRCVYARCEEKENSNFVYTTINAYGVRANIMYRANDWSDIIKGIDIYLSEPIYTIDPNEKIKRLISTTGNEGDVQSPGSRFYVLPQPDTDKIDKALCETANFYKIKSLELRSQTIQTFIFSIFSEDVQLDNLLLQEKLEDDYRSHHSIRAKYAYVYNARLHLCGVSSRLFSGFDYRYMQAQHSGSTSTYYVKGLSVTVYIKTDSGNIIVQRSSSDGFLKTKTGSEFSYFYYPDSRAYKAVIRMQMLVDGAYVPRSKTLTLTPHPFLNGAYYFEPGMNSLTWDTQDVELDPVTEQSEETLNKIYVSEANNPFSFPPASIYTIGNGEILGLSSTTKALSQGQFGQFPLYAFTTEGIWALEVSQTGTYSTRQAVTRDVCNNPLSITQIDGAVVFTTNRGVMVLQGSEVECLSDVMMGKHFRTDSLDGVDGDREDIRVLTDGISDDLSFGDFIAGCLVAYDYANARLIFFNPAAAYQYVYSLASGAYSKLFYGTRFIRLVNSYPDCYLQDEAGGVYNFSFRQDVNDVKERIMGLVVTRPLKFGTPGLKSITRMLHRGDWNKDEAWIRIGLYGSRDGHRYHQLTSLYGMPWNFYRLVLYTSMLPVERLTGTSCIIEERDTNKLR